MALAEGTFFVTVTIPVTVVAEENERLAAAIRDKDLGNEALRFALANGFALEADHMDNASLMLMIDKIATEEEATA